MLPEAGGARDQRAGELDRMLEANNTYEAIRLWLKRQPGKEDEWKKANGWAWEVVMRVERLKRIRD